MAAPDDRSRQYNTISYWTDLAKLLESATFDGIFIADVLGTYDVYGGTNEAAIRTRRPGARERPDPAGERDGRGHRETSDSASQPAPRSSTLTRSRDV